MGNEVYARKIMMAACQCDKSEQIPHLDELAKFFEMSLFESISIVVQHLDFLVLVQMVLVCPQIGILGLV